MTVIFLTQTSTSRIYPWYANTGEYDTLESRIPPPRGFVRPDLPVKSFGTWLRGLPLKPAGTPVYLWNGAKKHTQSRHAAVVDLDFIGKNLQQCVDVIIRLRAEYLWSTGRRKQIAFSYECCEEKIPWSKWREGWRTEVKKENGRYGFEWQRSAEPDDSRDNFRAYLFNIMMYAGTHALARDMKPTDTSELKAGDAFVQGARAGYGHGVIVIDEAVSPDGRKVILLAQSYNPAENLNILKSGISGLSPWFPTDFKGSLTTPEWTFKKRHARKF